MRNTRPGTRWVRRLAVTLVTAVMLIGLLAPAAAVAAPAQSWNGGDGWARVYTVRRGDSLAEIALQFGVPQEALMRANGIRNANLIYVGQELVIPELQGGTGGPSCSDYYTVRRGDTLSSIALYHGLETWELARANGIYDLNEIYVGQQLCLAGRGGWNEPGPDYGWREPEPERGWSGPAGPEWTGPGPERGTGGPIQAGPVQGGPDKGGPVNPDRGPVVGPIPGPDGWQGPNQPGGPDRDGPGPDGPRPDGPDHGGPVPGGPMRADEYWKGTYFSDKYFAEFALERKDLEVNFNWFTGSPFSDMAQDRFSVRWEKLEHFKGGHYRFFAVADDGVRVIVDDQTIIDAWKIQPATEYKADIFLGEGIHKLVVEYYEEAEDAQIRVYWEPLRK